MATIDTFKYQQALRAHGIPSDEATKLAVALDEALVPAAKPAPRSELVKDLSTLCAKFGAIGYFIGFICGAVAGKFWF
jgi:hypothetical protein